MLMKKVLRMTLVLIMALVANVAMAQKVVTFTAGTDKGNNENATDPDTVSKKGITIITTTGAFNAKQFRFAKGATSTIASSEGAITKIVFTCTANNTAKYGPGNIETKDGSYAYENKVGTWTGNAGTVTFTTSNNQVRATKIEVTIAPNSDFVATPVISGDAIFAETTTVTITAGEGTTIKYTINGDDPTDDRGEVLKYTAPFTINQTTTVQAVAYKGGKASEVATKTFLKKALNGEGTMEKPYNVEDVIALQKAGVAPAKNVYVAGIVSQPAEAISQYNDINFYISDDGNTGNEIMAYNSKYFKEANYTDMKQVPAKGDKVVLCGKIIEFNNIIELGRGNYLVSLNGKTEGEAQEDTLTFTASEALAALAADKQPQGVCYITGTICEEVDTTGIGQFGNLTYKISDDGTAANSLIVFRSKSFDGAKYTKDFYLKKGDQVKILGQLINYVKEGTTEKTPEVQANSKLISVNGHTTGVNHVTIDKMNANAPMYNLAGQRVSKNYKGVVIQNGKKFFNK